jgi:hypothetical protein
MRELADGKSITGVTMDNVHEMNAAHAKDYDAVTKAVALDLLRRNARLRRRQSEPSATRSSIGRLRHRSIPTLPSHASSCSRITPSGTVITTSPAFKER